MRAADDAQLRISRTAQLAPLFKRLDKDNNGRLGDPVAEREDAAYTAQVRDSAGRSRSSSLALAHPNRC